MDGRRAGSRKLVAARRGRSDARGRRGAADDRRVQAQRHEERHDQDLPGRPPRDAQRAQPRRGLRRYPDVASAAGNIIIMLLCGIFVLSIKMECDFPETEWKYRFYIQSGMSSAKVRKGIIKECLLSGGLPVICGTIISILYCSMLLYAKHLQIEWVHRYFKGIILIVGAIWLLFAVFSLIFAYRNIRKIEGDSRDGKK